MFRRAAPKGATHYSSSSASADMNIHSLKANYFMAGRTTTNGALNLFGFHTRGHHLIFCLSKLRHDLSPICNQSFVMSFLLSSLIKKPPEKPGTIVTKCLHLYAWAASLYMRLYEMILAYTYPVFHNYFLICRPDGSSSHMDCSQFGPFCIRLAIGRISGRTQLKRIGMEPKGTETLIPTAGSERLRVQVITLSLILWALFASNFTKRLIT